MSNIKAGFKKCGIYPFDPNAIDTAKMKPSEMYSQPSTSSLNSTTDSERSGDKAHNSDMDESFLETDEVVQSECTNSALLHHTVVSQILLMKGMRVVQLIMLCLSMLQR